MNPLLTVAVTLWQTALDRARALRARDDADLGASAIEWAIISAIAVTAAVVIGGVIYNLVQSKGTSLQNCANQPAGAAGCP